MIILISIAFSGISYAVNENETVNNNTEPQYDSSFNNSSYSIAASGALPSYYDLRQQGRVTPVKAQVIDGPCWAFTAIGSLESCLLPGETWNFSENNMKNILSNLYPQGFDRNFSAGGNSEQALAYFARWSGPVNASSDPYNTTSGISPANLTAVKHIQECIFIAPRKNATDNDQLKEAIIKYGAIDASIYWNETFESEDGKSYYYNGSKINANHDICLVGWNDSYNSSNFKINPPGPGAFIIKNSWGTDQGDKGYNYISYYDMTFAYDILYVFMNAEPINNYKEIYQYDPFGYVTSMGNGSSAAFMNVFNATSNNPLTAASFYALVPNTSYQLYTVVNNTTSLVSKGVISTPGYKTIKFNPIPLVKGQEFKVWVNITTPNNDKPIAIEYAKENWTSKATSNLGESFYNFYDGNGWVDLKNDSEISNANVCLKAFTTFASQLTLSLKSSDLKPDEGDPLTLTYKVQNQGPDTASGVKVTSNLPKGLSYISYSTTDEYDPAMGGSDETQNPQYSASYGEFEHGGFDPESGIWDIGDLEVGESIYLFLNTLVDDDLDFFIDAFISSLTYNLNTDDDENITIDTQPRASGNPPKTTAQAFSPRTVGMLQTGIFNMPLLISLILLMAGIIIPRRK